MKCMLEYHDGPTHDTESRKGTFMSSYKTIGSMRDYCTPPSKEVMYPPVYANGTGDLIALNPVNVEFYSKIMISNLDFFAGREDYGVLLAYSLENAGFPVPRNLQKYLYYQQEVIGHHRWITTANAILRAHRAQIFNFSKSEIKSQRKMCDFVVNVYCPAFLKVFLASGAAQGPRLMLEIRNLLKYKEDFLVDKMKDCYLRHAKCWHIDNLALIFFDPKLGLDVTKINFNPVKVTTDNLWSFEDLVDFVNSEVLMSPIFDAPDNFWQHVAPLHNRTAERAIRKMTEVITEKRCKDDDEKILLKLKTDFQREQVVKHGLQV